MSPPLDLDPTSAPSGLVLAILVGAARTMPIAWLVPALGAGHLPRALRAGLGLALAALALPSLLPSVAALDAPPAYVLALLAREALVGAVIGFVASAAFRAAEAAGQLVDRVAVAGVGAPSSGSAGRRDSPLGRLYLLVAVIVFLEMGGLGRLAAALARSYQAIPIGARLALPSGTVALVTLTSAKLIESTVALAAPVLVASLLADVAIGLISRALPRAPVAAVAVPAKALLTLGVVLFGLGALDSALSAGMPGWMSLTERAFGR